MSRYEMNVAQGGKHYCRIVLHPEHESIRQDMSLSPDLSADDLALVMFNRIAARFPESERFNCSLTRWDESGETLAGGY